MRAQAHFDVAQTLPVGWLRECHAQELARAREGLDVAVSAVALDASSKKMKRRMIHHLGEDEFASVHRGPPQTGPQASPRRSPTRRRSSR